MPITIDDRLGSPGHALSFDGALAVTDLSRSFLLGKAYRAYKAFTANTQLRFVATKPFLLTFQSLYCDAGQATAVITAGSTNGGSWTVLPTKFPVNGVFLPAPTPTVAVEEGGTITGGTERERLRAASGAGVGIVNTVVSPRLLPAGTYSIALTVTGTTAAIYTLEYTELDTVPR
ncbi:hypothetical protein BotAed_00001 [Pseudomonas phage vB_PpuP-BotAed]